MMKNVEKNMKNDERRMGFKWFGSQASLCCLIFVAWMLRKAFTVAVMEPTKLEKQPMANKITKTANSLEIS